MSKNNDKKTAASPKAAATTENNQSKDFSKNPLSGWFDLASEVKPSRGERHIRRSWKARAGK
ncbi:MAG: hypothetical protein PHV02_16055 [Rhodocyclaceae bacterium]|nr:hypothetical protein [Rhodocyclaceae bacterium]